VRQSESIKAIAPALFALQKELEPVKKDSENPHFKNRYASLETINAYVIEMANKHGLLIIQGGGEKQPEGTIAVETRFVHVASGEWIASDLIMPLQKQDPQGAGSAITYGRRYNICAMLCISTEEDDDGEAASWPPTQRSGAKAGERSAPATPTKTDGGCPKCAGPMWDNRVGKKNPRSPDFKCKDRSCDGVIWPDKPKAVAAGGYDDPPPFDGEESPW
jgi:hypothetical protein